MKSQKEKAKRDRCLLSLFVKIIVLFLLNPLWPLGHGRSVFVHLRLPGWVEPGGQPFSRPHKPQLLHASTIRKTVTNISSQYLVPFFQGFDGQRQKEDRVNLSVVPHSAETSPALPILQVNVVAPAIDDRQDMHLHGPNRQSGITCSHFRSDYGCRCAPHQNQQRAQHAQQTFHFHFHSSPNKLFVCCSGID